jgi:hypothetical protein
MGCSLEDLIVFCAGTVSPYDCRGYWKVYHRPEKAKRAFAYMDRARVKIAGEFFPPLLRFFLNVLCRTPLPAKRFQMV